MTGESIKPALAAGVTLKRLPNGGHTFLIDGEEFPWHVAEEGPTIRQFADDWPGAFILNVPILVLFDADDETEQP